MDAETVDASQSLDNIKNTHAGRSPLAQTAAKLLYKRLQIKVLDGRVLVGDFICIDKQGNIILHQTVEHVERDGKLEEKVMGQVLIPATQRQSCEVLVVDQERQSIEELVGAVVQDTSNNNEPHVGKS